MVRIMGGKLSRLFTIPSAHRTTVRPPNVIAILIVRVSALPECAVGVRGSDAKNKATCAKVGGREHGGVHLRPHQFTFKGRQVAGRHVTTCAAGRQGARLELSPVTRKLPARVEPLKVLRNNAAHRMRAFDAKRGKGALFKDRVAAHKTRSSEHCHLVDRERSHPVRHRRRRSHSDFR